MLNKSAKLSKAGREVDSQVVKGLLADSCETDDIITELRVNCRQHQFIKGFRNLHPALGYADLYGRYLDNFPVFILTAPATLSRTRPRRKFSVINNADVIVPGLAGRKDRLFVHNTNINGLYFSLAGARR